MRRAVIVVNGILLIGRPYFMKSFSQGFLDSVSEGGQGDDTTKEAIARALDDSVVSAMMVLTVGIVRAALSMYGAITYDR